MRNILPSVLAAIVIAAGATSAHASEPVQVEMKVDFSGIDIKSAAGFETVKKKISLEAARACRFPATSADMRGGTVDQLCYRDLTETALAELEERRSHRLALAG